MPTRKKSKPASGRKRIETPEIIFLALPIVALVIVLVIVSLNGNAVSGKPSANTPSATIQAANPATATPASTAVVSTTPAVTPSAPATTPSSTTSSGAITTTVAPTSGAVTPAVSVTTTATGAVQTVRAGDPEGSGIHLTKTEGGIKFVLLVSPGHIGDNTFSVLLSEKDNQAVTDASLVRVSVNSLEMEMGVANLDLKPVGATSPGLYSAPDTALQMLSMVGKFNLGVLVQRPGKSDVSTTFELNVANS